MAEVMRDQVEASLRKIAAGSGGTDVVSAGWVDGIVIEGPHVTVALKVPAQQAKALEPVREAAETALRALPGVGRVTVVLTAERSGAAQSGPQLHGKSGMIDLPNVKKIVAVASGKGGVGKSTVAANLAIALSRLGLKVALFDADIYGPSVPRMTGIADAEPQVVDSKVKAFEAHGIKIMSIGFLVPEDSPIVWRGPMVMGALEQLLRDTEWGEIDVMVVDMPPGTGDTQLTMSQRVALAGAVIVSTPQDIALLDAKKGLTMFDKVEVPILGLIENMSYYICPACGHREDVFSHGGAKRTAEELKVDFLGEIPLDIKIRETSDGGTPIVTAEPDGPHAKAFLTIAEALKTKLATDRAKPSIRFA